MPNLSRESFIALATKAREASPRQTLAIPLSLRLLSDQLTPVLAYRRLVANDPREAPSFLLESVEGGERQGRYSILGAQPITEVIARAHDTQVRFSDLKSQISNPFPAPTSDIPHPTSPFDTLRDLYSDVSLLPAPELPACVLAGWFGYAGYDTVRYAEPQKLPFETAPKDDRNLPDLHFGFYDGVVIFDHVDKLVHLVQLAFVGPEAAPVPTSHFPLPTLEAAYDTALAKLRARLAQLQTHSKPLLSGLIPQDIPKPPLKSNLTRQQHAQMVARAKDYIAAGDIFQVVLGQRFERQSPADPFDVYRALRTVNPSPYMVYMQSQGCILVASSPEILCRVERLSPSDVSHKLSAVSFGVTNRPLAGTRKRGHTPAEDAALERDLLADPKERAEHIMLVDLGRNDVGQVAVPGTIETPRLMEVERYSHVMHISSTVTGTLRPGLTCWDALRATLPVGTISGAPKIRAMQIIDELEPLRRGPYGGGMGYVGLDGQMDIALTLRTMVVPTALHTGATWTYHLQAAGGIVADSDPAAEYEETVNKAAALARAISVAEAAFSPTGNSETSL
jgi:anthranilate synthase component 1